MSKYATVLVGLPGSGKSYFLECHSYDSVFDDCGRDASIKDQIIKMPNNTTVALADPTFCIESTRNSVVSFLAKNGFIVDLVFWENNPERAISNVKNRNDGRAVSEEYVAMLSKQYTPPTNCRIIYSRHES